MQIIKDFYLNKVTTLKIGGPAKEFIVVKTEQDLIETIRDANNKAQDCLVIGRGSNLLVSDKGVDKLVIKNDINGIDVIPAKAGIHLMVKSGTSLQELVDFSIQNSLSGLQKLTGIPGTVGGAVFGNAGAFGQTISDYITEVACFDGENIKILTKDNCNFNYRDSGFKRSGFIILEIKFQLPRGNSEELQQEADETLQKRLSKYKPGILCPGSFFKNILVENLTPEQKNLIPKERDYYGKVPAWYFLDEVGARGDQLGKIKIADFHGNLFMNLGGGKASDFYNLAKKYYKLVKQKFGIELEPEVQLINLLPIK